MASSFCQFAGWHKPGSGSRGENQASTENRFIADLVRPESGTLLSTRAGGPGRVPPALARLLRANLSLRTWRPGKTEMAARVRTPHPLSLTRAVNLSPTQG